MGMRRHRATRITASAAVLVAICACGTAPEPDGDRAATPADWF